MVNRNSKFELSLIDVHQTRSDANRARSQTRPCQARMGGSKHWVESGRLACRPFSVLAVVVLAYRVGS